MQNGHFLLVYIVPKKVVKSVVESNYTLIKPIRVPLRYPYFIFFNYGHCGPNCLKKMVVQNMF